VTTPTRLAVVALALSLSTSAQKSWADGAEYDLHRSIASTPDPVRQIALIYEWQARYPQTGFEQERLQLLAYANKRAGKPEEAFATALQLLSSTATAQIRSCSLPGSDPLCPIHLSKKSQLSPMLPTNC
jgi:hypothetical protein